VLAFGLQRRRDTDHPSQLFVFSIFCLCLLFAPLLTEPSATHPSTFASSRVERPAGDRRTNVLTKPRGQRNRNQEHAVHEDLPRCGGLSDNDRQHGVAGMGIFVATIERHGSEAGGVQRKIMRTEISDSSPIFPVPANHRRNGAGGAANDKSTTTLRRAQSVGRDRKSLAESGGQPGAQHRKHDALLKRMANERA
jgi:hypothetical protein